MRLPELWPRSCHPRPNLTIPLFVRSDAARAAGVRVDRLSGLERRQPRRPELPVALVETVELTCRRFEDVDKSFAHDEGEGDRSLEYWRRAHRDYFTRQGAFSRGMDLYCERFRLVEVLDCDWRMSAGGGMARRFREAAL